MMDLRAEVKELKLKLARSSRWSQVSSFLQRRDLGLLGGASLTAFLLFGFIALADEVAEAETLSVDRRLLLALRKEGQLDEPIGPFWLREVARDVTALGSWSVLLMITLFVLGLLALERRWRISAVVVVAIGGGWIASTLLKLLFARPRPDVIPHFVETLTHSFPSGHSMLAAVTYLTLGALASQLASRNKVKIYVLASCVILAILVGLTRVYLGVHYPTDVLAGWTLGFAWATACLIVTRLLLLRGMLRPPSASQQG